MKNLYLKHILSAFMCSIPFLLPAQDWPKVPNAYSWEGTWTPAFPIPNMYDDFYYDAHLKNGIATPVLPPGNWDWGQDHNLATWVGFRDNTGHFAALKDNSGKIFGWNLILKNIPADLTAGAAYFRGSPGADILDLKAGSTIHSTGEISLGDGPDILRFEKSYSMFSRTGSSFTGSMHDNDLVIMGRNIIPLDGSVDIKQSAISTGPGRDLVFVNNMGSAGIDAGCGAGGRTDTTDPNDGDDIVVYGGNMNDFRFMGGKGNDLAVWYADEVQQQAAGWTWLGPNFFGGGAWGKALWDDPGTDRLIMAVSPNTQVNNVYGSPPPGQLNVYLLNNYDSKPWIDGPTENDLYARYCITCGIGPKQKKTITLEYRSPDGKVNTGRFWLTAFEELQIGTGPGAKVYKLDDINGTATLDNSLQAIMPPLRNDYNQLISSYINSLALEDPAEPGYPPTELKIDGLLAYPNPAANQLIVKFISKNPHNIDCTLSMIDLSGQLFFKEKNSVIPGENTYQMDVSGLKKGVYIVVLQTDELTERAKLVIE